MAVNPQDKRYRNYIGRKIIVPIVERKVKIIADKYVSINQGSGALKVTLLPMILMILKLGKDTNLNL